MYIIAAGVFFHIFQCSWKHHWWSLTSILFRERISHQPDMIHSNPPENFGLRLLTPIKYHTHTHTHTYRTYTYICIYASNPIQSVLGQTLWKPGQNKSNPMQSTPNHKLIVYIYIYMYMYIYVYIIYIYIYHICIMWLHMYIYIYILLPHPHTDIYIYVYIYMVIHI